jgi:BirA family biotin operon repressor/biotin-[acetyl-CoA-carboxylase] ligase
VWESEAGQNLTFSVLLRPEDVPANRPFVISEAASLCVKYSLDKYIADVTVKWPNDVYCGDKKIAGILIENILFHGKITQSVIGIGININQTTFHGNAPNPVSMAQLTGKPFDRMAILDDFRQILATQSVRIDNGHFAAIHNEYLTCIYRKKGFHLYRDAQSVFKAVIRDIEPSGHLLLERADGRLSRYAFKEVSYEGIF